MGVHFLSFLTLRYKVYFFSFWTWANLALICFAQQKEAEMTSCIFEAELRSTNSALAFLKHFILGTSYPAGRKSHSMKKPCKGD